MADEYDGALFLFKKNLTDEQKEQCKRQVQENPPYLNPDNKYAQELHQQRINAQEEQEIELIQTDEEKERVKEANETLVRLNVLATRLGNVLDVDAKELNDKLAQMAYDCEEFHVNSKDSKVEELKNELLQVLENINKTKELISKYEKKVNSGFNLTDEEKQQLDEMEAVYLDFDKIKDLITKTQDSFCETLLEKMDLISQINELFNEVNEETAIGLKNYISFYEFIKNAKEMVSGESEELDELQRLYMQTCEETHNVSHLLDIIDYTNLEYCSLAELQDFKKELENTLITIDPEKPCYSDKIVQLVNKFNQIREKEFSYIKPTTVKEKQQITQKTIETPEINEVAPAITSKTQTTNEVFDGFINKFASKISPLLLPNVLKATKSMLLANISIDEFSQLKNDKNEIAEFIVRKNNEMKTQKKALRLKNASRYAYVGVLGNEKMSLKEISIAIKNIDDKNTLENIDNLFERFNKPMQDLLAKESSTFKKVFEAILYFAPEFDKETRKDIFDEFLYQGQYLTLFVSKETPNEIKIELLKTLFESFDEKCSTSYTQKVIQNFENYIKQTEEERMQQAKLEDLDQYDWTL